MKVSTTGYKRNSKDKKHKQLYIPGDILTMLGVDDYVSATPQYPDGSLGQTTTMTPGTPRISFPGAVGVIEEKLPKAQLGIIDDLFKRRALNQYPAMQNVYGPKGENLNIIRDKNFDASSHGFGDIEFVFPGSGTVNYSDNYTYQSPTPDKYTAVYNPKGAGRGDVFLDMLHGMRNDPRYMELLQNFGNTVKDARGDDMRFFYEKELLDGRAIDGMDHWNDNYIDGMLRAELYPYTPGRPSARKDYEIERQESSPEMQKAAMDIYNYLRTGSKQLSEQQQGGQLPKAQKGEEWEQALQRQQNRQQARAWDPNELNGAQEVPTDNVAVRPMTIAPPAINAPKKSKDQIAKEAAQKTNKKAQNDPTVWLAEHPEYMLDADGNPVLRSSMEANAPEDRKALDIKQAKEDFLKDLNTNPLQQSLGNASLDNPVTKAAAERYADYKVNNVDPGRASDQLFRSYQTPTTKDFYQPNEFSNTLRGAAGLGATAAGVAGLSAGLSYLPALGEAAYAWGATNPFLQATGSALSASPTWAPGLSMANALNAGFITHGVSQLPETYSAWDNAINNNGSYLDATGQTLLNSLDFLGVGELKAPGILDDIIGKSIQQASAAGVDPAKVFVENLGKEGVVKPEAIANFTKEQWQEAAKFLERRQFVKQLQKDKLIGEGVKPADVNYFARFNDRVNRLTQNALDADATLYRGVRGDKPHAGYQEYTGREYDMMQPAWGNEISEYENMVRAGVDFENPLSIAEYQATHVPMESYGYRSGMPDMFKVDALYATSEPSNYYGNYLFEMKLPRDYSKGNFKDWYDKYIKGQTYLSDVWDAEHKAGRSIHDYVTPSNKEIPLRLSRSGYPVVIGKKGEKLLSVNKDFPFTDLKRMNTDPEYAKAFNEYRDRVRNNYHTGWINDELDLTSLYRVEPKGASFPTYSDPNDLRYTEWSGYLDSFLKNPEYANNLMQHPDIYKTFTDPKTGEKMVGMFYPQSTEGNWWTSIHPDQKALSGSFLNKGNPQILEVKVPRKILPDYEAHKVSGWADNPHPDKPEWILPSEWRNKAKITEWDFSKKKIMSPFLKQTESPEYLNALQNEYNSLTEKGIENLTPDELLKALELEKQLNTGSGTTAEAFSDAAATTATAGKEPVDLSKLPGKFTTGDVNPDNLEFRSIKLNDTGETLFAPFTKDTDTPYHVTYRNDLENYFSSPEFNRIMDTQYPDVDKELYKQAVFKNLEKPLAYDPNMVSENATGTYYPKGYLANPNFPNFSQRVKNANKSNVVSSTGGKSYVNSERSVKHEYDHQRTNASELLPDFLKQDDIVANMSEAGKAKTKAEIDAGTKNRGDNYYSKPTEFDVRVRRLKEDLKENGIVAQHAFSHLY